MQTTRRSGRDAAEAVLRAQLGLARVAVDGLAQGATAYGSCGERWAGQRFRPWRPQPRHNVGTSIR